MKNRRGGGGLWGLRVASSAGRQQEGCLLSSPRPFGVPAWREERFLLGWSLIEKTKPTCLKRWQLFQNVPPVILEPCIAALLAAAAGAPGASFRARWASASPSLPSLPSPEGQELSEVSVQALQDTRCWQSRRLSRGGSGVSCLS